MAVCNLFNTFNNDSGNFLLFSQYVEDLTKNYVNGNNYRVVPSSFIALNIDYSSKDGIPINDDSGNNRRNFNIDIPAYFQNVFENGCAYLRSKEGFNWTPNNAKYMFWNHLWKTRLISSNSPTNNKTLNEVVYRGEINMHSYNEHNGMGYGDIYCYIPTSAKKKECTIISMPKEDYMKYDDENKSNILIGRDENYMFNIDKYQQTYYYSNHLNNKEFEFTEVNSNYYDINTIVLFYNIYENINGVWNTEPLFKDIPMGMYFAGKFNDNGTLTNPIKKYVTTEYGSGTSYGLRICTRFLADPSGKINSTIETTEDTGYANMSQLMSAMAENLSKTLEVTKSVKTTIDEYKETLSVIKNNRTNVPYIHKINGKDFWFVNGRMLSEVDNTPTTGDDPTDEDDNI